MSELRTCLKVDVDTHQGMREGVPRLLDAFARHGVRASFFLSFGPDNAGKAILNVFRQRGFLRKMLRTGAPSLYGWRTLVSGTLLPARPIAAAMPELVRAIEREGHEVGVHAWDHRRWQDWLPRLSEAEIEREIALAHDAYAEILGRPARSAAAPAWLQVEASLRAQDRRGLLYASDMRGGEPGYPRLGGWSSSTLQIPSTQPCLEELLGRGQRDPRTWVEAICSPPAGGPATRVLPLHAEVEGGPHGAFLAELLARVGGEGPVLTLERYAQDLLRDPPAERPAALRALRGRAGRVLSFEPADAVNGA